MKLNVVIFLTTTLIWLQGASLIKFYYDYICTHYFITGFDKVSIYLVPSILWILVVDFLIYPKLKKLAKLQLDKKIDIVEDKDYSGTSKPSTLSKRKHLKY